MLRLSATNRAQYRIAPATVAAAEATTMPPASTPPTATTPATSVAGATTAAAASPDTTTRVTTMRQRGTGFPST